MWITLPPPYRQNIQEKCWGIQGYCWSQGWWASTLPASSVLQDYRTKHSRRPSSILVISILIFVYSETATSDAWPIAATYLFPECTAIHSSTEKLPDLHGHPSTLYYGQCFESQMMPINNKWPHTMAGKLHPPISKIIIVMLLIYNFFQSSNVYVKRIDTCMWILTHSQHPDWFWLQSNT